MHRRQDHLGRTAHPAGNLSLSTARAIVEAHVDQGRATAECLIVGDIVFINPQDDHVDRDSETHRNVEPATSDDAPIKELHGAQGGRKSPLASRKSP
jgi:hypothetical protein